MAQRTRTVIRLTGNYFGIANTIIDTHGRTLGAIGVGVYAALARFADRTTGECWPAIAKLERALNLARSTVKVYLHKLEALGLIAIEKRWDAAGDPTSNLYTLLDPSPTAIATRLAAREVADTASQEHACADAKRGGPSNDPPSADTHPTGRPPGAPEQSSAEQKKENKSECSRTDQNQPRRTRVNPCPHPAPEISCIDGLHICHHCWTIVEQHDTICHLVDVEEGSVARSSPHAA